MITFSYRLPEPFGDKMRPFRSVLMAGHCALLLAAAALAGCLFDNSSGAPKDPGPVTNTTTYSVKGNTITLLPSTRSHAYCDMDTLKTLIDTLKGDTVEFQIAGPALRVTWDRDTMESGAVVLQSAVFSRQGSGTGLNGLWLSSGQEYKVVSGTLTESEKAGYDRYVDYEADRRIETKSWLRFADGKLTGYESKDHAALFIREWNSDEYGRLPMTMTYAIDVLAIDPLTIELKGRMNGETVRIAWSGREDAAYSSSMPAHATYRHFRDPTSCPNDNGPQWYGEFLQANWIQPVQVPQPAGVLP
jgi:hypothetical protein